MKTLFFTLLQTVVLASGAAAYFLAGSLPLAGAAAGMVVFLFVAQKMMASSAASHDEQPTTPEHVSDDIVTDEQDSARVPESSPSTPVRMPVDVDSVTSSPVAESVPMVAESAPVSVPAPVISRDDTLDDVIAPPMPHRATVAAFLQMAGLGDPDEQLERFDEVVAEIEEGDDDCQDTAAQFCSELTGNVLGVALEGLAALAVGDLDNARRFFEEATQLNSSWAMPWLGWATVLYEQGDYSELAAQHPHINGVELLSYDCGDEETFAGLADSEQERLLDIYQQTSASLGNYYAAAELAKSRMAAEGLRRVA